MSIVDMSVGSTMNEQSAPSYVVPSPPSLRHASAFVVLEHSRTTLRIECVDGVLVWRERSDTSLYHGFRTCPPVEKLIVIEPAPASVLHQPRRWYASYGDRLYASYANPRTGKKHLDFLGFVEQVQVI